MQFLLGTFQTDIAEVLRQDVWMFNHIDHFIWLVRVRKVAMLFHSKLGHGGVHVMLEGGQFVLEFPGRVQTDYERLKLVALGPVKAAILATGA